MAAPSSPENPNRIFEAAQPRLWDGDEARHPTRASITPHNRVGCTASCSSSGGCCMLSLHPSTTCRGQHYPATPIIRMCGVAFGSYCGEEWQRTLLHELISTPPTPPNVWWGANIHSLPCLWPLAIEHLPHELPAQSTYCMASPRLREDCFSR